MNKQISPFAELTGAEKQIRWLEYQTIRLPYIDITASSQAEIINNLSTAHINHENEVLQKTDSMMQHTRPQPPPEVPRTIVVDSRKTRHSQYDAVIARLKQAELQAKRYSEIK